MGTSVVPDSSSTLAKKEQVEKMFDGIASRYDLLNRVLSFRIDVLWRREVIRILSRFKPLRILYVAKKSAT